MKKRAAITLALAFSLASSGAGRKIIPLKLNHPAENSGTIIINADCGQIKDTPWDFFRDIDPYKHASWKIPAGEQTDKSRLSFIIGHLIKYERTWNAEKLQKLVNACDGKININEILKNAPEPLK